MGEIVRRSGAGGPPAQPPSFEGFERIAAALADVREVAAIAREPSPELLARIDQAIKLVEQQRAVIQGAAAPAARGSVGGYLALLMKAYTNSGMQDSKVFGRLMLEDVMSMEPTIAAVEIACRQWRRSSKFLPAISELLVEVKAAKSQVDNTVEFIERLPALRERIARDLGESA
ncbi:MAG: hypothetical protein H0U63_04210 [Burkholderiales bacterium]|nr:hypothetical protein [Burkholderiales bacterium]